MDLILWRHAEAHPQAQRADRSRARADAKGERQAQRMAEWLNASSADVDADPGQPGAAHAADRARARPDRSRRRRALAPGAQRRRAAAARRAGPTSGEPVLVVGHQPTLGTGRCAAAGRRWIQSGRCRKGGRLVAARARAATAPAQVTCRRCRRPICCSAARRGPRQTRLGSDAPAAGQSVVPSAHQPRPPPTMSSPPRRRRRTMAAVVRPSAPCLGGPDSAERHGRRGDQRRYRRTARRAKRQRRSACADAQRRIARVRHAGRRQCAAASAATSASSS